MGLAVRARRCGTRRGRGLRRGAGAAGAARCARARRSGGPGIEAGHHALEVQRSDFELAQDKESGLLRYSLRMPLTGSYAQLRGFLADALGSDAALSLDKLRLRRASAGSPAVEADLTWSFYMRPGSMAVPGSPR